MYLGEGSYVVVIFAIAVAAVRELSLSLLETQFISFCDVLGTFL